jgi:hypothetical protein
MVIVDGDGGQVMFNGHEDARVGREMNKKIQD